ncbi:MAG: hypothetical protein WCX82_02860 [archaeon]|jgi:hypothetical protein
MAGVAKRPAKMSPVFRIPKDKKAVVAKELFELKKVNGQWFPKKVGAEKIILKTIFESINELELPKVKKSWTKETVGSIIEDSIHQSRQIVRDILDQTSKHTGIQNIETYNEVFLKDIYYHHLKVRGITPSVLKQKGFTLDEIKKIKTGDYFFRK